jgi:hypothetical protein
MRYKPPLQYYIQILSKCFLGFFVTFLIMIPLSFGLEENSWRDLFLECIEGDCENGKGTMNYYSTQKYVGEFKDGKRHGQGTLYLPLHRKLSGKWRDDAIIEGTATLSDSTRYTGTWQYGYRHGKGELTYPDGRKYIGEFHAGNKHGQGKMIYPDGRVYTGEYKEGNRTGFGTMTYPDGKKISGRFLDGEYVGPRKKSQNVPE